mmetsp:Transcript_33541/g.56249  ORF Transcript_33541/g.56249 Transcript_33541/m.56249 type:complete len:424 (-) Transcript_33541:207-1478(-)
MSRVPIPGLKNVNFIVVLIAGSYLISTLPLRLCQKQPRPVSSLRAINLGNKDAFRAMDINKDGHVTVMEVIHSQTGAVLTRSSLFKSFFRQIRDLGIFFTDSVVLKKMLAEMKLIISPFDLIIVGMCILSYRTILRKLFDWGHRAMRSASTSPEDDCSYEQSLIGVFEVPLKLSVWFPVFLCIVDVLSVVGANIKEVLGFKLRGNVAKVLYIVYSSVIIGSFVTRFKDWLMRKIRLRTAATTGTQQDFAKDSLSDELFSFIIWIFIGLFCLQAMTLELGLAIGSILTVGGIGSASFVLALRSTMENAVGGVLLKLQDKLRIGEKVSSPTRPDDEGEVESINLLSTRLRYDDDSVVAVPNAVFIQGEVVNWSRTRYRYFRTTTVLRPQDLSALAEVIRGDRGAAAAAWRRDGRSRPHRVICGLQ